MEINGLPKEKAKYLKAVRANEKIHSINDIVTTEKVREYLGQQLLANFKEPSDHIAIASVIRYRPPATVRKPGQQAALKALKLPMLQAGVVSATPRLRDVRSRRPTRVAPRTQIKRQDTPVQTKKMFKLTSTSVAYLSKGNFESHEYVVDKTVGTITRTSTKTWTANIVDSFTNVRFQQGGHSSDTRKRAGKDHVIIDFRYKLSIKDGGKPGNTVRYFLANTEVNKEKLRKFLEFIRPVLNWKSVQKIDTVIKRLGGRRRMAQREFSDKRDSPVMVRLLEEIVEANQKHNERQRRKELN